MPKNYLSVVYSDKSHPYTDYPKQLCAYLFQLFHLELRINFSVGRES